MIARRWRGWADGPANADAYVAHFERTVRPQLEATDGFVDARLERVPGEGGRTELVVVTRWASLDAIRAFAGDDVETAVYYPEDDRYLVERDLQVKHYDVTSGEQR
jgi:heme-degrading monooxygenase HmoA